MSIVSQLLLNSLITASVLMLIALGFNLAYATTKFFNMAYGALILVGGYALFFFTNALGLNFYLSVFLSIIVSAFVSFLLERIVYRPLRAKKASDLALLIASLGAFTLLQAVIAIIFSSQFQALNSLIKGQKTFFILGGLITQIQLVILITGIVIMCILALVLKKTMLGKQIRAIADDIEVAKIIGINTDKVIGYVFIITGAIVGIGGLLHGLDIGIDPAIGLRLLLFGIIAAIVGGIGNVYGSVLGALLVGFAANFGIWFIPSEWMQAIVYGILILFLIFRPQGILGTGK